MRTFKAREQSAAARWDELTREGAAFGIYPTVNPARFLGDGEVEVQAAERHPNLRRGHFGIAYVVERERIICTFGGTATLPRIIGTRTTRKERGTRMRYALAVARRQAEEEARTPRCERCDHKRSEHRALPDGTHECLGSEVCRCQKYTASLLALGEEFAEDARVAARRNTHEAARTHLARLNRDGSKPWRA